MIHYLEYTRSSFDRARREAPGHRFADVSEQGFGAAVLTDSKYGYSCRSGELRVSRFAYALLPHAGGWREAGVLAEAHRFNAPMRWVETGLPPTVERAEDSDALVLRLYEAHDARGTARLRLSVPFDTARLANGLEEKEDMLELEDSVKVA